MVHKHLLPILFCLAVLFVSVGQNAIASEARTNKANTGWNDPFYTGPFGVRTWTDITGNHRVEGRFVELLPKQIVRLQRPSGRFLRINLAELSRADRELVQQITEK